MHFSAYLAIAIGALVNPILAVAATILHLRVLRPSTLLTAIGVWAMLAGGLSTVFLILRATWTTAYASAEAAETVNFYFAISGVVTYVGMVVFAVGLLWFSFQQPKPTKRTSAT